MTDVRPMGWFSLATAIALMALGAVTMARHRRAVAAGDLQRARQHQQGTWGFLFGICLVLTALARITGGTVHRVFWASAILAFLASLVVFIRLVRAGRPSPAPQPADVPPVVPPSGHRRDRDRTSDG